MEFPRRGPVVHGDTRELFVGVPAADVILPSNRTVFGPLGEIDRLVLLRDSGSDKGRRYFGVPDDNRSVVLPDVTAEVGGRGYAVSVKGVGARAPLYGDSPLDFAFEADFGPTPHPIPGGLAGPRGFTGEAWFGESPYGAQGEMPATYGLRVTELAKGATIHGFHICPVLAVLEIPREATRDARGRYWYRRYRGRFLQEQRLVPSNIRLYHQSALTLGQAPGRVLELFGVVSPDAHYAFVDRYIASGIAALTVFVRTMRPCPRGVLGLDYANVWLDKDCLVAPDGTLHFADLEGMEWALAGQDWTLEERVREQFDHNFYEFMYGLDVVARERERAAGRVATQGERRATLIPRFEVALAGDRFVRCETSESGLDLVVRPNLGGHDDIVIRLIDLE